MQHYSITLPSEHRYLLPRQPTHLHAEARALYTSQYPDYPRVSPLALSLTPEMTQL